MKRLIFFLLLVLTGSFLFAAKQYASGTHPPLIPPPQLPPVTACPTNYVGVIQKIDPDNSIRCYGAKGGLGFATTGLQQICGPVLCPVEPAHDNLQRGQSCIRKDASGVCHPGTGASGFFDKDSDPNACPGNINVTIPCPPSLPLYIKAVDQNGNAVLDAKLKIAYNDAPPLNIKPKTTTIATQNADSTGVVKIVGMLYSGDHFTITPLTENNASDSAHMVGNSLKFFQEEMNAPFSCGQSASKPCFVLVNKAFTSGNDYIFLVIVLILVALFLMYILR